jgi:hypothetical protein
MHQRPTGKSKDEVLPLGNCEELELKDGKLFGRPCFDPGDVFALQIYNKVENGTIRMASAGLVPLEWKLDDMSGELWLERSRLVEVSLADIGANPEALAVSLYDENEELIQLSGEYLSSIVTKPKTILNMKLIQLSADALPILGLAEGTKPEDVLAKIQEMVTLTTTQKDQIVTLSQEKESAETKATDLQVKLDAEIKLATDAKITTLVNGAKEAKKITADQVPHYEKLAAADFDSTKSILDSLATNPSLKTQTEQKAEEASERLEKLSWSELDKSGELVALKAQFPDIFARKFKAEFGREPQS